MTTQAIGYRRCSTVGQVDGEGLGVQSDKIEGWCRLQGLDLVRIEEDAGLSGATLNRPGLQRALDGVLALGRDGVLVVARLDRLGRSAIDVQVTLRTLMDANVRVVAINDGIDTGSGMGSAIVKLLVGILSTFGELEREIIRTRLLDGRRRASRENRVYASEPAFGRRVAEDGRTLLADAGERAVVQRARELREAGASYRHICRHLAAEGYRPRRAAAWSPTVVRRLVLRAGAQVQAAA
jgi:site-specific DNA recombinase